MVWMPLLQIQRDLLNQPRGMVRFQAYLNSMVDEHGRLRLPLSAFNPMSKDHVVALLDELLAMKAEGVGEAAMTEAVGRLPSAGRLTDVRVGLVIADDAKGGWTNRWLFEARHKFELRYEVKHGMLTALLWSGDVVNESTVRAEVLAAIFRRTWIAARGLPGTLREMLMQEGSAGRFAGLRCDGVPAGVMASLREHLDSTHYPTIVACLFGDSAALECGYDPVGLPERAGLRYALSDDFLSGHDAMREPLI